jgi:hypothetical protein
MHLSFTGRDLFTYFRSQNVRACSTLSKGSVSFVARVSVCFWLQAVAQRAGEHCVRAQTPDLPRTEASTGPKRQTDSMQMGMLNLR